MLQRITSVHDRSPKAAFIKQRTALSVAMTIYVVVVALTLEIIPGWIVIVAMIGWNFFGNSLAVYSMVSFRKHGGEEV
jgi:hypothetical protein